MHLSRLTVAAFVLVSSPAMLQATCINPVKHVEKKVVPSVVQAAGTAAHAATTAAGAAVDAANAAKMAETLANPKMAAEEAQKAIKGAAEAGKKPVDVLTGGATKAANSVARNTKVVVQAALTKAESDKAAASKAAGEAAKAAGVAAAAAAKAASDAAAAAKTAADDAANSVLPMEAYCGKWREHSDPSSKVHKENFHSRLGIDEVKLRLDLEVGDANVFWVKRGGCEVHPEE